MQKLKNKLFDVLARNISIESFEQWLYNDVDILNAIERDDVVLSLVDRDYKSKNILNDLEKYLIENYNFDEFFVFLVEESYQKLSRVSDFDSIESILNVLQQFYNKNCDYQLLFEFYYLVYDDYFENKQNYISRVKNLAKEKVRILN